MEAHGQEVHFQLTVLEPAPAAFDQLRSYAQTTPTANSASTARQLVISS
jgi:hypothetical protein